MGTRPVRHAPSHCASLLKRFIKQLPITLHTAILLLGSVQAKALDPTRQISQYAHTAWRIESGDFNGGTPSIFAQTPDGYLWLGTNVGLLRYDGTRYVSWIPPAGQRLPDSRIYSLWAGRDGTLWIGTAGGLARWSNGKLVSYPQVRGRIESMSEDPEGAIWLVRSQATDGKGPLCRIKSDDVRCYGASDGVPFDWAMMVAADPSGNIWIDGAYGLSRWRPGSSNTYFLRKETGKPMVIANIKAIAAGKDGRFSAIVEKTTPGMELQEYANGRWTSRILPDIDATNADVITMFIDRENNLWIGTAHHGLYRVRGNETEHYGSLEGLSSDAIGTFYEDAEGTIWVVTSGGVDNFRDLSVATFSMREGMTTDGMSSVIAAKDGTVWVGNFAALNYVRNDKLSAIQEGQGLPGRNVTTLLEDHAHRLWVGIDSGLWVYDHGRFQPILHADGSDLGIIFSIGEDIDQSIWVRAGPNLDRIQDFKVKDEYNSPQISISYILAANPKGGGIYLGLVNGDLVRFQDGKAETFPANEGDNPRQIRDLLVEPDGSVWGTTLDELFRWKDGRRENLTTHNGLPCDGIYALVKDDLGNTWLSARCGFIAIANSDLEKWWKYPSTVVKTRLIGPLDGVQPGLTSLKPQTAKTPDGRLWFVNARILQMMDPGHLHTNSIPPPVHIEQIVADRKIYAPENGVHIPALTRDLEIDYAALSFVVPQKVRYRYKLEGRDNEWRDPEHRPQAFYSDLPPGSYRFRVIACNNDGVWNETGATWSFVIEPAYYQTGWFRLACVLLAALTLWFFYWLRMRRLRATINARFDERIAERTRLARELHDTLLQTIQGSRIVADDALEESSDPAQMRRALERLASWLAQATEEGRAALNSLRTSTTEGNDLAQAFERAARECSEKSSMEFSMVVEGDAQEIHPIVRDEVFRIGYEAIRNACTHSGGSRLEVDLAYARDLVLRVRDNGKGIHPEVAASGRDGHFGLKGMQERAVRVGGNLNLSSSLYSGTEVELVVPGNVVFTNIKSPWKSVLDKVRMLMGRNGGSSDKRS